METICTNPFSIFVVPISIVTYLNFPAGKDCGSLTRETSQIILDLSLLVSLKPHMKIFWRGKSWSVYLPFWEEADIIFQKIHIGFQIPLSLAPPLFQICWTQRRIFWLGALPTRGEHPAQLVVDIFGRNIDIWFDVIEFGRRSDDQIFELSDSSKVRWQLCHPQVSSVTAVSTAPSHSRAK